MGVHWVGTLIHSLTLLTFRGVLEPEKEHTEFRVVDTGPRRKQESGCAFPILSSTGKARGQLYLGTRWVRKEETQNKCTLNSTNTARDIVARVSPSTQDTKSSSIFPTCL